MEIKYGRKRNGIKRELKSKIDEWIDSIEDEKVRKLARKDTIVTGGSICSMLLGEPVNDFDVYFRTQSTTIAVAKYYAEKFTQENILQENIYQPFVKVGKKENIKGEIEERVMIWCHSAGIAAEDEEAEALPPKDLVITAEREGEQLSEGKSYRPVFLSENAITLSDKVQIVIRFYGEPEQIHKNFDFVHAMCWWDHGKEVLHLDPDAMEMMLSRTLTYTGSLYPIASIFRMKKFIERGWRITAGQQLKIMWQISEINLKEEQILMEQLTGVDQAYMFELIKALKGVNPEKINSSYVATIIDRIFE